MTGFSDSIKFGDITEITQDDSIAFYVDVSDAGPGAGEPVLADGRPRRVPERRVHAFGGDEVEAGVWRRAHGGEHQDRLATASGARRPGPSTWSRGSAATSHPGPLRRAAVPRGAELQVLRGAHAGRAARRARDDDGLQGRGHGARLARAGRHHVRRPLEEPRRAERAAAAARARAFRGTTGPRSRGSRPRPAPAGSDAAAFARRASDAPQAPAPLFAVAADSRTGRGDPLVRWMASREPGHCELFAGALVLMARSAGFPARVVTGFKGGTWNAYSGNYTIRNSDAHAWAEVWDGQKEGVAQGGSARDRRPWERVRGDGRRGARRPDGPQLVRAAQQPSRLLVPADR